MRHARYVQKGCLPTCFPITPFWPGLRTSKSYKRGPFDCASGIQWRRQLDGRRIDDKGFRCGVPSPLNLRDTILDAGKTSNRVTVFLVERLPAELWEARVPGAPRRTIRMLAGHIHNARCVCRLRMSEMRGLKRTDLEGETLHDRRSV
jgi:hypothetical protein